MLLTHIAIHLSISVAFMSLPTVSIYIIYIIYVYIYTKHTTRTHKYYIVYIAVLLTGKCHLQSLLSSRASTVMSAEFLQVLPLHTPHTEVHSSPFFLQLHRSEMQLFLQLQRMTDSKWAGAAGRSVIFETWPLSLIIQPQSVALKVFSDPFHRWI